MLRQFITMKVKLFNMCTSCAIVKVNTNKNNTIYKVVIQMVILRTTVLILNQKKRDKDHLLRVFVEF